MKTKILILTKNIAAFLLVITFCNTVNAQDGKLNVNSNQVPIEIISKSIGNNELWEESTLDFNTITPLYILNHGVNLDLPSNLKVSGKPVVLINKGDINELGNPPYFLFHTLNIEEAKAFVRLYLSFNMNGERKSDNVEIYFLKTQNGWEISNNQQ